MNTSQKVLHSGPRGGVYYLSPRGRKVYVPRKNLTGSSPQSPLNDFSSMSQSLPVTSGISNISNLPINVLYQRPQPLTSALAPLPLNTPFSSLAPQQPLSPRNSRVFLNGNSKKNGNYNNVDTEGSYDGYNNGSNENDGYDGYNNNESYDNNEYDNEEGYDGYNNNDYNNNESYDGYNNGHKSNGSQKLTPQQEKYCSCLKKVEAKGTAYNPYAVCAKSTGTTLGRGHHCPK